MQRCECSGGRLVLDILIEDTAGPVDPLIRMFDHLAKAPLKTLYLRAHGRSASDVSRLLFQAAVRLRSLQDLVLVIGRSSPLSPEELHLALHVLVSGLSICTVLFYVLTTCTSLRPAFQEGIDFPVMTSLTSIDLRALTGPAHPPEYLFAKQSGLVRAGHRVFARFSQSLPNLGRACMTAQSSFDHTTVWFDVVRTETSVDVRYSTTKTRSLCPCIT